MSCDKGVGQHNGDHGNSSDNSVPTPSQRALRLKVQSFSFIILYHKK